MGDPRRTQTPETRPARGAAPNSRQAFLPLAQAEGGRPSVAHVHGLVAALEQQPLLRVHHACLCPARREQPQSA
eukprot:scaffold142224_cov145-Phaeocystis_antarctica.AAC.1